MISFVSQLQAQDFVLLLRSCMECARGSGVEEATIAAGAAAGDKVGAANKTHYRQRPHSQLVFNPIREVDDDDCDSS